MATGSGYGMTKIEANERKRELKAQAKTSTRVAHRLISCVGDSGVCCTCGTVQVIPNTPSAVTKGGNPMRCPNSKRKLVSSDPRARNLQSRYGLTESDFHLLVTAQGSKCPICSKPYDDAERKTWHIDHCHTTGRIRGVLCFSCNAGLGNFKDSIDALQRAIDYLV